MPKSSLRKIIERLKTLYLGTIGFEYNFIRNDEMREWLAQKVEKEYFSYNPSREEKKSILSKLNEAVVFENFLPHQIPWTERFSLEGGENTNPCASDLLLISRQSWE